MASETKREQLGRIVREEWIRFAKEQTTYPKPSHLVGWDDLDPSNREVDCRIGEALFLQGVEESDEQRAHAAVRILGFEPDAFEGYLEKCSPMAMHRIREILAPVTEDVRIEQLSAYARREIGRRLEALRPPTATAAEPTPLGDHLYCHLAASEIPYFGTDKDTHHCAKLHRAVPTEETKKP